jgi:hypothetical protein
MEALLAAGADVHAVDHAGRTALHWLAFHCAPEHAPAAVRALAAGGADVNAQDSHGSTPLQVMWACEGYDYQRPDEEVAATGTALLGVGADAGQDFWAGKRMMEVPRGSRAALLGEAAWARRGALVRLRWRLRQAADAAYEAAAALVGLPALQAQVEAAEAEAAAANGRAACAEARAAAAEARLLALGHAV